MFLVVSISGITTFLLVLLFHKTIDKNPLVIKGYKVHHSLFSALLVILGLVFTHQYVNFISDVGLGIYASHVIEEVYFNHVGLVKALTVFITKT